MACRPNGLGDDVLGDGVRLVVALALLVLYHASLRRQQFLIEVIQQVSHPTGFHRQCHIQGGLGNRLEEIWCDPRWWCRLHRLRPLLETLEPCLLIAAGWRQTSSAQKDGRSRCGQAVHSSNRRDTTGDCNDGRFVVLVNNQREAVGKHELV